MGECARAALRTSRARFARLPATAVVCLVASLVGGSSGCNPQPEAPHGSPVMLGVWWVVGGDRTQVWGAAADAAISPVPPGASEIDFVFDRRLDGSRIEDTVGDQTVPKQNPPVTVSWPNQDTVMSDPPFADDVYYNSLAFYGAQSAYVFLRPRALGFPASTTLTFALDPTGITSAYGEPMTGPSTVEVTTGELGVARRTSSATNLLDTFPPNFQMPVQFTARPAPAAQVATFTHALADGREVPVTVAADPVDPTLVYVRPAFAAGWPPGAVVEVTFDAGLPDAFGVPTTAALEGGKFKVAGDAGSADASTCAVDAGSD
jgi:hypothetical protein